MKKIFDPEKYGMMFCTECQGKGKLPPNSEGLDVCPRCGGSGVVIKGKKTSKEDQE